MYSMMFEDDPSSRKVTRFLLLVQIPAVGIVLALILFESYWLALSLSCLTFLLFAAMGLWLYLHYQKIPVVQEKSQLQKRALHLRNKIAAQEDILQIADRKRRALFQDQRDEMKAILEKSQKSYIESGLAGSYIKDALIPSVGPRLRERLAEHRILTAAQIRNGKLSRVQGFGESKQQALISWRNTLRAKFESTKPIQLTDEQAEAIQGKYRALHHGNDTAERNAQARKRDYANELNVVRPRLDQLAPITFIAYISRSLDSRKAVGILLALLLIGAQFVSSVSATASSFIASIPTATSTLTNTLTPTASATPSRTQTSTATASATPSQTQTHTSTATAIPSQTRTATPATATPPPTFTSVPPTLVLIVPTQPAQAACSCSGDTLNCGDFSFQSSAQACYNYCISIGAGDIHGLDGNNDGSACESLP